MSASTSKADTMVENGKEAAFTRVMEELTNLSLVEEEELDWDWDLDQTEPNLDTSSDSEQEEKDSTPPNKDKLETEEGSDRKVHN